VRPLLVDDREPSGIPIVAFENEMLPENAFKFEAEPQGRPLGRLIQIVAFPFISAISKNIEHIGREEKLGFCRRRFARYERPPINAADFDDTEGRVDAHQRLASGDLTAQLIDDCKKKRIMACLRFVEPWRKCITTCWRVFHQPAEAAISIAHGRGLEQTVAMPLRIERF
jgi:hypothetical protein